MMEFSNSSLWQNRYKILLFSLKRNMFKKVHHNRNIFFENAANINSPLSRISAPSIPPPKNRKI